MVHTGYMERYTIQKFNKDYPDDAACLEWLYLFFYPDGIKCIKCGKVTKHHRIKSRPSYSCDVCGHHVHPTAGTIFEKSVTPLKLWFYAVFLMSSTRAGISAKQLERELGVTYKTAWRMFKQIRTMMAESDQLEGIVEIDEAYVGGVQKGQIGGRKMGTNKTAVLGMVERKGRARAKIIPETVSTPTIIPHIREHVHTGAIVMTDQFHPYNVLPQLGYEHHRIHHNKEYVRGLIHTNSVEGFWAIMKMGIRAVYRHVKPKYLQQYANEYAFRYSHRKDDKSMFLTLLSQVRKV